MIIVGKVEVEIINNIMTESMLKSATMRKMMKLSIVIKLMNSL
jgi:hypothetical protein